MVISVAMSSAICNTEQTAWIADSGGGVGDDTNGLATNTFSHSVESSAAEESDNSSTSSSSSSSRNRQNLSAIGCITTHNVTSVIRPEKKMSNFDPLQFVKIQNNELSKKAVEQIKLAEEEKITKEKIKEVEEEWQNNLMNWKSKRKINKSSDDDEVSPANNAQGKTKTFREILKEKASSGGRIGYDLHRYADVTYDNELDLEHDDLESDQSLSSDECVRAGGAHLHSSAGHLNMFESSSPQQSSVTSGTTPVESGDLTFAQSDAQKSDRSALGDIVVFDTTLLHEFSVNANCDSQPEQSEMQPPPQQQQQQHMQPQSPPSGMEEQSLEQTQPARKAEIVNDDASCRDMKEKSINNNNNSNSAANIEPSKQSGASIASPTLAEQHETMAPGKAKVQVPITQWKSSPATPIGAQTIPEEPARTYDSSDDDENNLHNSSYEDEEDELDEELEKLRLDQERSFKAKLHAFENLAKKEEEAARKAKESYRVRRENRTQAKLAAERSKSLGNLQARSIEKIPVSATLSGSSLLNSHHHKPEVVATERSSGQSSGHLPVSAQPVLAAKSLQNLNNHNASSGNNNADSPSKFISGNSVVYNFTNKPTKTEAALKSLISPSAPSQPTSNGTQQPAKAQPKVSPQQTTSNLPSANAFSENNIYENINPAQFSANVLPHSQPQNMKPQVIAPEVHSQIQQQQQFPLASTQLNPKSQLPETTISDSNAMRSASQKLLHQQQQIYQNQPPALPQQATYGNYGDYSQQIGRRQYDEVGLPIPMHITKTTQANGPIVAPGKAYLPPGMMPMVSQPQPQMIAQQQQVPVTQQQVKMMHPIKPEEEHLYMNQNQLLISGGQPTMMPPSQMHYRPNSVVYDGYQMPQQAPEYYGHHAEPNYENNAMLQQKRMLLLDEGGIYGEHQYVQQAPAGQLPPHTVQQMTGQPTGQMHLYSNSAPQYLYYSPKPFSAGPQAIKPIAMKLQQVPQPQPRMTVPVPQGQLPPQAMGRFVPNPMPGQPMVTAQSPMPPPGARVAYNQNHWLLQEAELRRQIDSMENGAAAVNGQQPPLMKPPGAVPQQQQVPQPVGGAPQAGQRPPNTGAPGGFLSVSGKKKCSNCGEELGKGCAAMVVESLSLYYHINCFKCSVCNTQLGNGTVGTDVRVRNNKLHCQNCYSNDEAGLKFSRV